MKRGVTIVFLGAPLAGKTTLREKLASQIPLLSFEFGSLLREAAVENSNSPHAKLAKSVIEEGTLLDDTSAEKIFLQYIRADASDNLAIDGFPRTEGAVPAFKRYIQNFGRDPHKVIIVHLFVDEDVVSCRAENRCRDDDRDHKVRKMRMKLYREQTPPTLQALSKAYPVIQINGKDSIDRNTKAIISSIQSL